MFNCVCDKMCRAIFQKHSTPDRSSFLARVTAPREIARGIEAARAQGDLARCDKEKLFNRSCVYTLRSIFSCSNSLPGYYSLPLIIIANWSLAFFLSLSPSLYSSSWRIMKTVLCLWSSFRVSRAVITIASRKILPHGQGVPAIVFSSFFVSLFHIVH